MTKPTKELTLEEMTEMLYGRAEEIFLLCAIITRRGLAHAFCSLNAHVDTLDCRVMPLDTKYQEPHHQFSVAVLNADLTMKGFLSPQFQVENFQKQMSEMDTYVTYLDLIITSNEPITLASQEHAA